MLTDSVGSGRLVVYYRTYNSAALSKHILVASYRSLNRTARHDLLTMKFSGWSGSAVAYCKGFWPSWVIRTAQSPRWQQLRDWKLNDNMSCIRMHLFGYLGFWHLHCATICGYPWVKCLLCEISVPKMHSLSLIAACLLQASVVSSLPTNGSHHSLLYSDKVSLRYDKRNYVGSDSNLRT